MANGHPKICDQVRETLKKNTVSFTEKEIQNATKFLCESGILKANIVIFNTGKPHVEGSDSQLKTWLTQGLHGIVWVVGE